jgi:hypothetical protein
VTDLLTRIDLVIDTDIRALTPPPVHTLAEQRARSLADLDLLRDAEDPVQWLKGQRLDLRDVLTESESDWLLASHHQPEPLGIFGPFDTSERTEFRLLFRAGGVVR